MFGMPRFRAIPAEAIPIALESAFPLVRPEGLRPGLVPAEVPAQHLMEIRRRRLGLVQRREELLPRDPEFLQDLAERHGSEDTAALPIPRGVDGAIDALEDGAQLTCQRAIPSLAF